MHPWPAELLQDLVSLCVKQHLELLVSHRNVVTHTTSAVKPLILLLIVRQGWCDKLNPHNQQSSTSLYCVYESGFGHLCVVCWLPSNSGIWVGVTHVAPT